MAKPDKLSPREQTVAAAYARGDSYKEIARALEISPTTVRGYLSAIYRKLEVSSKVALAKKLTMVQQELVGDIGGPLEPGKPSIAVLAFDNMSNDPDQEYFSDGITEDIITALSRSPWLFVIARNTSFLYKGQSVDIREAARDLGVRFVLEGSVQRAQNKVRVNAQLIDGHTGGHVWSDRYDGALKDVFALQDEITSGVVASIQTQMQVVAGAAVVNPMSRPSPGVWDLTMQAWALFHRYHPESFRQAHTLLDQASEIDDTASELYHIRSVIMSHEAMLDFVPDRAAHFKAALAHGQRAVQLNPNNEYGHWATGLSYFGLDLLEEAVAPLQRAVELNPNCSPAHNSLGSALGMMGETDRGIAHIDLSIRIDPRAPTIFFRHAALSLVNFVGGRYREAEAWAERVLIGNPVWYWGHFCLVASLWAQGEAKKAHAAVEACLAANPNINTAQIEDSSGGARRSLEAFTASLHQAGIPS